MISGCVKQEILWKRGSLLFPVPPARSSTEGIRGWHLLRNKVPIFRHAVYRHITSWVRIWYLPQTTVRHHDVGKRRCVFPRGDKCAALKYDEWAISPFRALFRSSLIKIKVEATSLGYYGVRNGLLIIPRYINDLSFGDPLKMPAQNPTVANWQH